MINLKVFEINFYYLIVAETQESAISLFHQLTNKKMVKVRECNVEKEGYVTFNEKVYKLTSYQSMLDDMINQQKVLHYPFVLRAKSNNH